MLEVYEIKKERYFIEFTSFNNGLFPRFTVSAYRNEQHE